MENQEIKEKKVHDLKKFLNEIKPIQARESFLVDLLLAYTELDENLKNRLLALNHRFAQLDKRLSTLADLDKDVRDKLLQAINERFSDVVSHFESELKKISDPLENEKNELKKIGREAVKINNSVLKNAADIKNVSSQITIDLKSFTKWLPILVFICCLSVALNALLVYKIFI